MMQIRKESVKNMQEYRLPPCKVEEMKKIGGGGNGIVYQLPDSKQKTVIKIFSADKKFNNDKRDRRYQRFCKEICVQKELAGQVKGVLPVYDHSFPVEYTEMKPAWYTMPKADKFMVRDKLSLVEKLERMLELAEIIRELHKRGMAHRDIKPDNLLIYNDKIHLADYGLIWLDGEESFTLVDERLGPSRIMPPELEEREEIRVCDYTKSDVYLFAKVMWMYLKEDKYGFKGEYTRGDPQIYLKLKQCSDKTMEPLHQLLEGATKHEWADRFLIDNCIDLLKREILILLGEFPVEEEQAYSKKERLLFYKANIKADATTYEDSKKITTFLYDMKPTLEISSMLWREKVVLHPITVREEGTNFYIFTQELGTEMVQRFALHIRRLEIGENMVTVYLSRLTEQEKGIASSFDATVIDEVCEGIVY